MIDENKLKYDLMAKTHKERFNDYKTGAKGIYYLSDDINECIDNQPKIGGWIPCSERLPEEERFYIVTYKFDDEKNYKCHELYYGVADGENDASWYIDDDCERLYKPFTVIAWQPLPEAYHG